MSALTDLVGRASPQDTRQISPDSLILYALSVGATPDELECVYEACPGGLVGLDTFALVDSVAATDRVRAALAEIGLDDVILASQEVEIDGDVPSSGSASTITTIVDVHDRGKSAVVVGEAHTAVDGRRAWVNRFQMFVPGAGGFGGERGEALGPRSAPEGPPDTVSPLPSTTATPALYRLCGDRHPIHIDRKVAADAGHPEPPLHGMWIVGSAYLALFKHRRWPLQGPRSVSVRYLGPAYPGSALEARLWGGGSEAFADVTSPGDTPVCRVACRFGH